MHMKKEKYTKTTIVLLHLINYRIQMILLKLSAGIETGTVIALIFYIVHDSVEEDKLCLIFFRILDPQ